MLHGFLDDSHGEEGTLLPDVILFLNMEEGKYRECITGNGTLLANRRGYSKLTSLGYGSVRRIGHVEEFYFVLVRLFSTLRDHGIHFFHCTSRAE